MRLTSIPALAAMILPLSPATAPGEEEEDELQPLVVEADRHSVLPEHFAGSATVIDREKIAKSGVRSVADLLATQGGIRLTNTSGNASDSTVHLRGFGENASSRVLVLIDGRPVNRPDMAGVSWLEAPVARLERVEILRGSQSARFGDNAVGGVINLVTRGGSTESTVLEGAGGSDGYTLARISHRSLIDGHGITFDAERNFTDGWRDNAFSELETAALRWDKQLADWIDADLGVSWADERGGFPGPLTKQRYLLDPRQSIYAQSGQAHLYFSEQTRWTADGTLTFGKAGGPTIEVPLSIYQRDLAWNFGPGYHTDNLLNTYTLSPRFGITGDSWSAEAGISLRRDTLELSQFAEIQRRNRTTDASLERDIAGIFAGAEWEPWKYWHLSTSARWEHSSVGADARSYRFPANPALNFARETDESNSAFQAGVRWEGARDVSAWLRYDRLYRLPSTDEIASYQGYPLTVPFNDRLRAETGDNVELGAEWTPGAWTLRVNGFAQWLEGEIAYDYLQNLNVNLADTRRLGLETTLGYQAGIWDAALHFTALQSEFRSGTYEGKEVYLVPNRELTATLGCRPKDWLSLQAEYQYVGDAFEGNDFQNTREKLPSYGVANFLVRYEPKPGLSLYCRINNLFDERYATVKYSGIWYPAAGRQVLIGIRREL
ncbi:TonB-dependent receptor [Luteolibacter flavescens]|uniref:TonB-dependent receptor n=1 Tax=Luteolibacter flavescens TaxID=1859460 RepID=A0ABT3FS97_9BACT|nr:TonB-dependent receptor [Luteolibacter flavescens]MCW1886443.1 TonB-dependent receptor [Luteolibacter flavescens]